MEQDRTTNGLEELVRLMNLQEERVLAMWEDEHRSGLVNPALDKAIRTQKELLLDVLQLLFDLGLEDCKRHTPWEHTVMLRKRYANQKAEVAKCYAEVEEILDKRLGKLRQADAHPGERTTDAQANEADDCNEIDNRAEPLTALSPRQAVQSASLVEKLVKLENIQDQRVLALREEENRLGFINPGLDTAIRLQKELLLSIQGVAFDLALERYQRRTPREQIAAYREQEERNQRATYEAYKGLEEFFSQDSVQRRLAKLADDETLGHGR